MFTLFIDDLIQDLNGAEISRIQISETEEVAAVMYADDLANVSDTVTGLQSVIELE